MLHYYLYIDPGSGSLIFQTMIAGIAGIIAFVKIYWKKVKSFFKPREKK